MPPGDFSDPGPDFLGLFDGFVIFTRRISSLALVGVRIAPSRNSQSNRRTGDPWSCLTWTNYYPAVPRTHDVNSYDKRHVALTIHAI